MMIGRIVITSEQSHRLGAVFAAGLVMCYIIMLCHFVRTGECKGWG